jgi:ferredoxin-NADP reductase/ferredoxin
MTAGAVCYEGRELPLAAGETVLDTLERAGVSVPSGCRAGVCCKCIMRSPEPPPKSQRGLRPTLAQQGYFLACQARPTGTLLVEAGPPVTETRARVLSIEIVGADVARLCLAPATDFVYRPGQFLDVRHPSGATRSYSIASLPSDGRIELHVRRAPEGLVSGWLHTLDVGDEVVVAGPHGQCFHVADDQDRKLVLVGAGTGLAPHVGIARDALAQGHRGPIDLVHGALEPTRLYLRDELRALALTAPQLRIHAVVLREATNGEHEGSLDVVAVRLAGPLQGARVYLCGDGALVRTLQRSFFLAGAASREILADPFEAHPSPRVA